MSNEFKIRTTAESIVIEDANGEHVAEYASRDQRSDAAKMRRAIKQHLNQAGATLGNYNW